MVVRASAAQPRPLVRRNVRRFICCSAHILWFRGSPPVKSEGGAAGASSRFRASPWLGGLGQAGRRREAPAGRWVAGLGSAFSGAAGRAGFRLGSDNLKISSVAVQNLTGTLGEAGALVSPVGGSPASAMLATWPTTFPASSTTGAPLEPGANSAVTFRKRIGRVNIPLGMAVLVVKLVGPKVQTRDHPLGEHE